MADFIPPANGSSHGSCIFVVLIYIVTMYGIVKEPRTHPEPNSQLKLKDIAINIISLFCKQK